MTSTQIPYSVLSNNDVTFPILLHKVEYYPLYLDPFYFILSVNWIINWGVSRFHGTFNKQAYQLGASMDGHMEIILEFVGTRPGIPTVVELN